SFLALNGDPLVLQNPSIGRDGDLFPQNLLNRPFFIVNGAMDPLYPAYIEEPFITHMKRGGVELVYHRKENGVHNTSWWPEERDGFEAFVREHPRNPLPVTLTWETDLGARTNRAQWLVIDRVTQERDDRTPLKDLNDFESERESDAGNSSLDP